MPHACRPRRTASRPTWTTRHRSADAIGDQDFDAVVDWLAFTPDQVRARTDLFRGRVGQYVFISSASAYQTPPSRLPITESTPLRNPYWQYSRDKIACEDLLTALYREEGYPMTIVRPSHTYDETHVPLEGGWTAVDRMRRGEPVVVHGDGTSLWTLTHHTDFARDFVHLLGNPRTLGEAFHITSDDVLTWDQIAHALGAAAGARPAHRARPVGRYRRGRRRLGRSASRRQGALHGVRQQQDPQPQSRNGSRPSASRRAPARSWPGTMPTPARRQVDARVDGLMSRSRGTLLDVMLRPAASEPTARGGPARWRARAWLRRWRPAPSRPVPQRWWESPSAPTGCGARRCRSRSGRRRSAI